MVFIFDVAIIMHLVSTYQFYRSFNQLIKVILAYRANTIVICSKLLFDIIAFTKLAR